MTAGPESAATPVSVVIPVYNAPADLAACVASVLEHTRGSYRLVVIDDASPDPAIAAFFRELGGVAWRTSSSW